MQYRFMYTYIYRQIDRKRDRQRQMINKEREREIPWPVLVPLLGWRPQTEQFCEICVHLLHLCSCVLTSVCRDTKHTEVQTSKSRKRGRRRMKARRGCPGKWSKSSIRKIKDRENNTLIKTYHMLQLALILSLNKLVRGQSR